jgi:hypothetical protein
MNTPDRNKPKPPLEKELWEAVLQALLGYFWRLLGHEPVKFALWVIWAAGSYFIITRLWQTYLPPIAPHEYVPPDVAQVRTQTTWTLIGWSAGGVLFSAFLLWIVCTGVQRGPLAWGWRDVLPLARWMEERKRRTQPPPPPPYGPGDLVLGRPYTPRDDGHWQDSGQWSEQPLAGKTFNLTRNEARLNTLIVAPQNTGKTTVMRDYLSWCICNGYNVIVTDPKGEDDAEHAQYATHRLDLDEPERSHFLWIWVPR